MLWIILAFTIAACYAVWKYITYTNKKWVMMNNIILAKITYNKISEEERKNVDDRVDKVVKRSPFHGNSIDDVGVEADKWRYYSIALAEERIPPLLDNSLGWAPGNGVRNDVEMAHSIYKFEERLENGDYSEEHLSLMKR